MEYFVTVAIILVTGLILVRNMPKKLLAPIIVGNFLIGFAWDYFALTRGWWSYSDNYLLGPKFFSIPVEDFAFFIGVPLTIIGGANLFAQWLGFKKWF